jgi:hypothetical protein
MSVRFRLRFIVVAMSLSVASGTGCLWVDNDCDTVVTECFDVCDTYCNAFTCWTECFTDCDDRCVASGRNTGASPVPVEPTGCQANSECARGYYCSGSGECIPDGSGAQAGLCEACATRADCREENALCLLLNEASESGFCGRACQADADCPADYGCRSAGGTLQCVPNDTTCSDQVPLDACVVSSDCRTGFVCTEGYCGPPPIPCESSADCARGFICNQGECKLGE